MATKRKDLKMDYKEKVAYLKELHNRLGNYADVETYLMDMAYYKNNRLYADLVRLYEELEEKGEFV